MFKVGFVNVTEDPLSFVVPLAPCSTTIIKLLLCALKQKSISWHSTLSNLLWEITVYKVTKSKGEIEPAVVRLFMLSIPYLSGWLSKIVKKMLIPFNLVEKYLKHNRKWFYVDVDVAIKNRAFVGFLCNLVNQYTYGEHLFSPFTRNLYLSKNLVRFSLMSFSLMVFIILMVLLLLLLSIVTPNVFIKVKGTLVQIWKYVYVHIKTIPGEIWILSPKISWVICPWNLWIS